MINTKNVIFACLLFLIASIAQAQSEVNIIPKPQEVAISEGSFAINAQTKIYFQSENQTVAKQVKQYIVAGLVGDVELVEAKKGKKGILFQKNDDLGKEAYELTVSEKGISIMASGTTGWFYGMQTLKQLFPITFGQAASKPSSIDIQALEIKDTPRFAWRAFMLDESRFFKGEKQVKMLLDEMASLKMNVFHWHLVDDQGWRIEIKKYPKLTEIGSKRKSTQVGPLKWNSPIQSAEPHEGFYTQDEIKEIVQYAADRQITIVPEIEMPGHSSAAIASYSWLGTSKNEIEVPIKFGVGPDVYDVSDPKVYKFLTDVLDEVMTLFPSNVIHIGGDEVRYNRWKESESIKSYMKEKDLSSPAELQVYFTNSISQYLQSKGRRMMGWNEIMGHNLHEYQDDADTKSEQQLAQETVIHFWKGDVALATEAASNGYEIVNSLHSNTYLDYDYKTTPLSKAYSFDPVPSELDPKYHSKVIGTGCQMWGEWIPTDGHMHFMVFPRIAAYAEVGWTQKSNKDFNRFKAGLPRFQKQWTEKGIYFAPDEVVEKPTEK